MLLKFFYIYNQLAQQVKLGRNHVTALVKGNVETPGDITGVVYTNMDSAGAWKFELAKNMQAVGINVDLNKFLK